MGVAETHPDAGTDSSLVATIEAVEEGDLLVVNGDARTWDVTDVVDRRIEEPDDERLSKRVLRLSSDTATFGLELVEYPGCHEATLHVLETDDWVEAEQTYDVQDVEILDQQVPWVVVTGSAANTYHIPDAHAAAYGEARPACGAGTDDSDYRITRLSAVYPAYSGCKSCLRYAKPTTLESVECPDCEKVVCRGVLQDVTIVAVDGLAITCERCGFDSVADVTLGSGGEW